MKIVTIFLLVGLVGCSTGTMNEKTPHEQMNERWAGKSKEDVIKKMGAPDSIFKNTLGEDSFSYMQRELKFSHIYTFTFDSSGNVTFVRMQATQDAAQVENEIEQRRIDDEQRSLESERILRMGDAFRGAARGPSPPQ